MWSIKMGELNLNGDLMGLTLMDVDQRRLSSGQTLISGRDLPSRWKMSMVSE